jgi:hypothetical protein
MTLDYNELINLVDVSIAELKQYVDTYEDGEMYEITKSTL